MESPAEEARRAHYDSLLRRKKKADHANTICFWMHCTAILYTTIPLYIASGKDKQSLLYMIFLIPSILLAVTGCLKRSRRLNIAAIAVYLLGCLISLNIPNLLYVFCSGISIWSNHTEDQLKTEEGYPYFDLELEKNASAEKIRKQMQNYYIEKALANASGKKAQIGSKTSGSEDMQIPSIDAPPAAPLPPRPEPSAQPLQIPDIEASPARTQSAEPPAEEPLKMQGL